MAIVSIWIQKNLMKAKSDEKPKEKPKNKKKKKKKKASDPKSKDSAGKEVSEDTLLTELKE